ncbi:hypothetical protein BC827DRAFT_1251275 [Russula dissimulans]|nr:hypothetical protein BC827DRAFT_1251275 [Russula dissimulans]
MSPVAPIEAPLHHIVIVDSTSDEENSTMSFLSGLRGLDPGLPSPAPSSSTLLEPPLPPLPAESQPQPGSSPRSRPGRPRSPSGTKPHGSKSKSRERDHSARRDRTRERRPSGADSMLTLMLAEEERNSSNLKALVQITRERLETETRRADAAESRATLAEARAREVGGRAAAAEQGLHRCELEAARAQEETKRAQMQLETVERELRRMTNEMQRLTRQKEEADNAAAKARDLARSWQSALRDYQAHDEGRQEGLRLALIRRYDDGREEGWEEGRNEGWDEGREEGFYEGRRAGFEEGREMGMKEVRVNGGQHYNRWKESPSTLRRFGGDLPVIPDRSLLRDSKGRSESLERTRTWVESVGADESIRSHSPKPRPTWLTRRMTPEAFHDELQ